MPTRTQGYVALTADSAIQLVDIELSDPQAGEVLVEVVAASLCASDLKAAAGKFMLRPPLILGHEASGIVQQVGEGVQHVVPGDKVVLSFAQCRDCRFCRRGMPAYCVRLAEMNWSGRRADGSYVAVVVEGEQRTLVNGFFFGQSSLARHVLAHASSCVVLPHETTQDELKSATGLACGIQTGVGAILNVAKPDKGARIVVLGVGSVGISAALAALLTEPKQLILVDNDKTKFMRLSTRLAANGLIREAGPAVLHIDSSALDGDETLTSTLLEVTDGDGADLVIECVGSGSLIEAAMPALAARGMVVTVGGPPIGAQAAVTVQDLLAKGLTWRGTHQGDSDPHKFIPYLISLKRRGMLPYHQLLTFYDFDSLDAALADLRRGLVYKPVLVVR